MVPQRRVHSYHSIIQIFFMKWILLNICFRLQARWAWMDRHTLLIPNSEMNFHTSFDDAKEPFLWITGSVLASLAVSALNEKSQKTIKTFRNDQRQSPVQILVTSDTDTGNSKWMWLNSKLLILRDFWYTIRPYSLSLVILHAMTQSLVNLLLEIVQCSLSECSLFVSICVKWG